MLSDAESDTYNNIEKFGNAQPKSQKALSCALNLRLFASEPNIPQFATVSFLFLKDYKMDGGGKCYGFLLLTLSANKNTILLCHHLLQTGLSWTA